MEGLGLFFFASCAVAGLAAFYPLFPCEPAPPAAVTQVPTLRSRPMFSGQMIQTTPP
jgi:hypothetical protein